MARTSFRRPPSYRLHKATGQAVVTLGGKDFYLGSHGSTVSKEKYGQLIAEWIGRGELPASTAAISHGQDQYSISKLILGYLKHCLNYYRNSPREIEKIKLALRILRRLYGHTAAAHFGPLALKSFQAKLAQALARRTVNMRVDIVRRMFKWAAGNEMIPVTVYQALMTVEGLKRGRSAAREGKKVLPVDDVTVEKTLAFLGSHVAAMVRLQRLTGARSGEICSMRPCDLDRTGEVWVFRPIKHKTTYLDYDRLIFLGPRAQEVLRPFLAGCKSSEHIFSPRKAMADRYRFLRATRTSKVQPSQISRAKSRPRRTPGECYDTKSYYHAIRRACVRGGISLWFPHQLRHSAATELRKAFGIEAARAVLGQQHLSVTEIYAQVDADKARDVMRRLG